MPPNMRPLMRVARLQSAPSRRTPQTQMQTQTLLLRGFASGGAGGRLPGGTPGESSVQAYPIGPYYEAILTKPQPIPEKKPEEPPTSSPKSPRAGAAKKAATAAQQKPRTGGDSHTPPGTTSTSPSKLTPPPSSSSGTTTSTSKSTSTPSSTSASIHSSSTTTAIPTSPTPTDPPELSSEPGTAQDKARIIFGSRLAGPAERADRLQSIRARSALVGGVLVPPRPEEPDNCCMSGCVNCVWDLYRDEMEEWAAASARADGALQAQRSTPTSTTTPAASVDTASTDSTHAASRQNEEMAKTDRPKIAKDLWDDDLYTNIPVGIREFMKHEKKLKKKHEEEGTFGA
ncbi:oxidoreductase-like protein [Nemania sp. FL0916]|nr:oxidoreductase-like protein [Nemania sp. FL0916]